MTTRKPRAEILLRATDTLVVFTQMEGLSVLEGIVVFKVAAWMAETLIRNPMISDADFIAAKDVEITRLINDVTELIPLIDAIKESVKHDPQTNPPHSTP